MWRAAAMRRMGHCPWGPCPRFRSLSPSPTPCDCTVSVPSLQTTACATFRHNLPSRRSNLIPQGFETARKATLEFLETFKQPLPAPPAATVAAANAAADAEGAAPPPVDRETLHCVARTSLRTKLAEPLADQLTDIVTDSVLMVRRPNQPIDLFMVRLG